MNRDIDLYVLGNKTLTAIRYHNETLRPIVWPYSGAVVLSRVQQYPASCGETLGTVPGE